MTQLKASCILPVTARGNPLKLESNLIEKDTATDDGHLKPAAQKFPPTTTQQDDHTDQGDQYNINHGKGDGAKEEVFGDGASNTTAAYRAVLPGTKNGGSAVGTADGTTKEATTAATAADPHPLDDLSDNNKPAPAKKRSHLRALLSNEKRSELLELRNTYCEGSFLELFDPQGTKLDHGADLVGGYNDFHQSCVAFSNLYTHHQHLVGYHCLFQKHFALTFMIH
jgi:hypothetical protein